MRTRSLHIKQHAENCMPRESKYKQQLLTFYFNKKTVKLSESEKLAIKDAELQFCICRYHSFNSLENDRLNTLIQTFVNITGKYGVFEVKDLLCNRNTISLFSREKPAEIKKSLKLNLVEPLEAESVTVTIIYGHLTTIITYILMCLHFGLTNCFKLSTSIYPNVILESNIILQKLSKIFYVNMVSMFSK